MTVSILVVDDESDVAELFRQRFRREVRQGTYAMHFANSGEEALERLVGGTEPELIVIPSDINMPGMDGLILLRAESGQAQARVLLAALDLKKNKTTTENAHSRRVRFHR
jgi:CheY-like chemotaxis protein